MTHDHFRRLGSRAGGVAILLASIILGGLAPRAASALPVFTGGMELVTTGAESVQSLYQVSDGHKRRYPNPSSFDLVEIDPDAGDIRIHDFFLPPPIWSIGLYFAFTDVPGLLEGDIHLLANPGGPPQAEITFPEIEIGFSLNRYEGILDVTLTTGSLVIPAGCAGREEDQVISGSPLDLNTGYVELVAAVCPFTGFYQGDPESPETFDSAFRIFLKGTIHDLPAMTETPEPGTLLLLAGGLAASAALRRAGRR